MHTIGLQAKARVKAAEISWYWFENEHIGLPNTLFHRVVVPIGPFDSGLDYVSQPESTELVVEWAALNLDDPSNLDGVDLTMEKINGLEASIYVGSAHNWVDLKRFLISKQGDKLTVQCSAIVEFENEGIAQNEQWEFVTTARILGEV